MPTLKYRRHRGDWDVQEHVRKLWQGSNRWHAWIRWEYKNKGTIQDVEIEQCWICVVLWQPFWKWWPIEIFRCQESIRDIIIYPHMKCRWHRTMLNLWGIVVAILKMATDRKFMVHGKKERRRRIRRIRIRIRIRIIIIIIRNGAKTISPPNFVWET